jgi:hypothetical protein
MKNNETTVETTTSSLPIGNTVLGEVNEIKLNVEAQFCNRFDRQLVISIGNAELHSNVFDSRSDEAKRLALELVRAAQQLLNHHELKWG